MAKKAKIQPTQAKKIPTFVARHLGEVIQTLEAIAHNAQAAPMLAERLAGMQVTTTKLFIEHHGIALKAGRKRKNGNDSQA